jgi:hypothetical protein
MLDLQLNPSDGQESVRMRRVVFSCKVEFGQCIGPIFLESVDSPQVVMNPGVISLHPDCCQIAILCTVKVVDVYSAR